MQLAYWAAFDQTPRKRICSDLFSWLDLYKSNSICLG